ncbi:STAS domain-containing protein [Peribacillus sp. SCS-155]|uniref:STAS domain-containing protein n=1 Tax=Peribacillus sedimenti TaxID=3115297 RepID=UPI003906549D
MALNLEEEFMELFRERKDEFEEQLLSEAKNVRDKIDHILAVGNIDLLNNAHQLVAFVLGEKEEELDKFSKLEGVSWAAHSLTLSFKLEWVQAIRRTMWQYLQKFDEEKRHPLDTSDFFELERKVNDRIDQFLNGFFLNYSAYKDQLIESQKKLVENLSVPIIPVSPKICVLPLIGDIDIYRSHTIEEKVLTEIGRLCIQTLIMDLSGIAEMETAVIDHLIKIIDGSNMMGCHPVITGLRPEIVSKITRLGFSFGKKAETKATLQQALEDYLSFS